VVAGLALTLLALPVAALRRLRAWRRGSAVDVVWTAGAFTGCGGEPFTVLDLTVDAPQHRGGEVAARLTDLVVRVAERLRREDDVYHLLRPEPHGAGPVAVPVGPLVQELGERFSLALARPMLAYRTALWLALPARRRLGEVADPREYDPEAPGEPEALLRRTAVRWAAASSFGRGGASIAFRLLLWVPEASAAGVEGIFDRLRTSLH
jgi:hypothetical protein